jgi:CBS domain-containing protein
MPERTEETRLIRDVMTKDPECVKDQDSVRDAALIMQRSDTGIVPVVDGDKRIIGLITDRDIVVRLVAEGKDSAKATVNEAMSRNVHSVREDTPVAEVLDLMRRSQIRRVPVVDAKNAIIGIVSVGDIAVETDRDRSVGATLKEISEAPPNN